MQRLRGMVSNHYGIPKKLEVLENHLDTTQETRTNNKRMRIMWLNSMLHQLMTKDETTLPQHICENIFFSVKILIQFVENGDFSGYILTCTYKYLPLPNVLYQTITFSSIFITLAAFHRFDNQILFY